LNDTTGNNEVILEKMIEDDKQKCLMSEYYLINFENEAHNFFCPKLIKLVSIIYADATMKVFYKASPTKKCVNVDLTKFETKFSINQGI